MAISSDKLLNRPSELHRRYGGRIAMQKSLQEKMVGGGSANIVLTKKSVKNIGIIKTKVIQIESILKGTLAVEKKSLDEKKRKESSQRRERQEEKLETKPNITMGQIKMPSAPRLGIFDWIKNFIGNIVLGYFAVRLIKHLPKIVPILKFIGQATDFAINIGGKLLDGLATFVDWGYKAYDATRGFIKNIGGENFAKGFDKFIGAIDTALFLTTVLAGDLALEAMTGKDDGGLGDLVGDQLKRRAAQQAATSAAGQAGGTAAQAGGLGAGAVAGIVAGAGLLASALGEGAFQVRKFAVRPIQKLENDQKSDKNPLTRIGRGIVLNMVRPLFGLFQTVGFLLDVVGAPFRYAIELLRYPFLSDEDKVKQANNLAKFDARIREDIRRALNMLTLGFAFKEKGSFGNIYGNKGSQKEMMGKMASGGITRGGKAQGGVKRKIGGTKKGKYKRTLAQKPTQTQFKTTDKKVKEVSENLDKTKYFGPVLAVSAKILENEKPTQKDYENVGLGLNLLIAKGVEEGQLKGGLVAAFAEGGMVDDEFLEAAEKGSNIGNWVSRTFQSLIESKVERNLRLIKEKAKPAGVPGPGQPGSPDMINIQGGDADFWTLVAVASREDGEPQAWADVAQSIYNRLASGAYSGKTIKDLVLGQMQYEPTWKFPKPGVTGKPNQEWYGIKDAASAGIAAGQSEEAMKKVAAAILDPTLQKNARDFIQGRTDFRGYSVSGGVQRKSGDNYFGWYNNYKANKIGSVPNFGATATGGGAGPGMTGPLGSGRVASVDQFGSVARQFGLTLTSDYRPGDPGYHGKNRARDYSNDSVGRGTPEQLRFAQHLVQNYGSSLTQLIYTPLGFGIANGKKVGLDYWGERTNAAHYHHVHVALAKGGRILKPTFALIAEEGPEFVFDADTTSGLDKLAPQLLDKLNMAKTKPQLANILQSYASYEQSGEVTVIEKPVIVERMIPFGDDSSSAMMFGGGGESDSFDSLYMGG